MNKGVRSQQSACSQATPPQDAYHPKTRHHPTHGHWPAPAPTTTPILHPANRDWGPGLAAAGIYGNVSIVGYDTGLLRSVHIRQQPQPDGAFVLLIEPELLLPLGGDSGSLLVDIPSLGISESKNISFPENGKGLAALEVRVPASKVKLWWPRGYGDQPLYEVFVKFASSAAPGGSSVSSMSRRIGFRTVELVEKPLKEAAAELLAAADGGWANSVGPGGGTRSCMGQWNCGQYGWVDGKKWTFISAPLKEDLNYPVTGYDFPGAYPNSSFPGGDNPWWVSWAGQRLGQTAVKRWPMPGQTLVQVALWRELTVI